MNPRMLETGTPAEFSSFSKSILFGILLGDSILRLPPQSSNKSYIYQHHLISSFYAVQQNSKELLERAFFCRYQVLERERMGTLPIASEMGDRKNFT
jgi:hypothetical protein